MGEVFSWSQHYELRFSASASGRLYVDNSLSGLTQVGRCVSRVVYRFPHSYRLKREYAEVLFRANAVLDHDTTILPSLDDTAEAMNVESTPPIRMRVVRKDS